MVGSFLKFRNTDLQGPSLVNLIMATSLRYTYWGEKVDYPYLYC